jgi:3-oxoacyl-[acyl-carrier-protein] synthase III
MKISAVSHKVPPTCMTNNEVLGLFREASKSACANGEWDGIERRLKFFLRAAGTLTRHISVEGENALDLAVAAANDAMDKAGIRASEIDLVVYASVARGWLEPCMAVALQEKIGAINATSFDILDACASWLRALHVVHGLIRAGAYNNVLIVSLESGMADFIRFDLPNPDVLRKYSAAITLGEAATSTIVTADCPDDDFYFTFKTYSEACHLCLMPLDNIRNYAPELQQEDMAPNKFMADSGVLIRETLECLQDVYKQNEKLAGSKFDICFSHAASVPSGETTCKALNIPLSTYFSTHERFGNTGAASIPLAMSLADDATRLQRGQRVLLAVGSAGITVGFATFTY